MAEPGGGAPDKLQMLLRAAPKTRPMTAAVRARSAAQIQRLAAKPPPRAARPLARVLTWGSAFAVALGSAGLWLAAARGPAPTLDVHALPHELICGEPRATSAPANASATRRSGHVDATLQAPLSDGDAVAPLPDPQPLGSADPREGAAMIALSAADACGRHVCFTNPWCCTEGWDSSCDAKLMADAVILESYQPLVGSCYYHDRRACPDCACPYYVKIAGEGFDGGTGCLNELGEVFEVLKTLCVTGRCEK